MEHVNNPFSKTQVDMCLQGEDIKVSSSLPPESAQQSSFNPKQNIKSKEALSWDEDKLKKRDTITQSSTMISQIQSHNKIEIVILKRIELSHAKGMPPL